MKTLEISEETYEKIKDQIGEGEKPMEINNSTDLIGVDVLVRTY